MRTTTPHIALRHIEDLRRNRCSSQQQRVLLSLLIEEEVKPLFDLLITHYAHVLALLLRCILDLTVDLRLLCLQAVQTYLQTLTHRTDSSDDVLPHGTQLLIQLLHYRVTVRSGTLNTHPLKQQRVVLRQARTQRSVGNTDIGRNEIIAFGVVTQELVHIVHQTQLRLYLCYSTLLGTTCVEVQLRLCFQMRDVVFLFVFRDRFLGVAEFLSDDSESLIDESSGIGRNHILVHQRIHVVLLNDLIQERLIAIRHRRFHGKIDDVRLFLMLRHLEQLTVVGHHQLMTFVNHFIGGVLAQRTVRMNTDSTHCCLYRLIQCLHTGGGTGEIAQFGFHFIARLSSFDRHGKRTDRRIFRQVDIIDRQRRITELAFPTHTVLYERILPEVKRINGLRDQPARTKHHQLVFGLRIAAQTQHRHRINFLAHHIALTQHDAGIGCPSRTFTHIVSNTQQQEEHHSYGKPPPVFQHHAHYLAHIYLVLIIFHSFQLSL